MTDAPEFTPARQEAFTRWVFANHPDWLDEFEAEIRIQLAELEAVMTHAADAFKALSAVLDDPAPESLAKVVPLVAVPAPVEPEAPKRKRRTKAEIAADEAAASEELEALARAAYAPKPEPETYPLHPDAALLDNGDDFEPFDIPADDADDEF